jgi:hypothetical protein
MRRTLLRSTVALFQSKRLHPDEQEWEEDIPLDYMLGFGDRTALGWPL